MVGVVVGLFEGGSWWRKVNSGVVRFFSREEICWRMGLRLCSSNAAKLASIGFEGGAIADHWNVLLHPPFNSVRASTHRIGSGSTLTEPITSPNLALKHPDLPTTHPLDLHHTRPPHS